MWSRKKKFFFRLNFSKISKNGSFTWPPKTSDSSNANGVYMSGFPPLSSANFSWGTFWSEAPPSHYTLPRGIPKVSTYKKKKKKKEENISFACVWFHLCLFMLLWCWLTWIPKVVGCETQPELSQSKHGRVLDCPAFPTDVRSSWFRGIFWFPDP